MRLFAGQGQVTRRAPNTQFVRRRSATEGLKIVGESFPWAPQPGWRPSRRVPAGGVNETKPAHTGRCGAFQPNAASEEHSTFVYLRANHKVRLEGPLV